MFIYKMPNYPGFYRKQYKKNTRFLELYSNANNLTITHVNEDEMQILPTFKNPCDYFIFFSFLTLWFGGYVRRKLYYILYK